MKSIKKILAPVDLTEHSFATLLQAAEIARYAGAQLVILHVYHKPVLSRAYEKLLDPEIVRMVERSRLAHLHTHIKDQYCQLINSIPDLMDVRIKFIKTKGFVVDKIIEVSEQENVDLIIMGAHRVKAISEFWGAKAAEVCLRLKIPALILPYQWALRKPDKIAFAYDLKSIRNMEDLDIIKLFSVMYNSEIHIITFIAGSKIAAKEEENIKSLRNHFAEFTPIIHTQPAADIEEGIYAYLKENKISLLVVLHRTRRMLDELFHESMTRKIVYHTDIPVLALDDRKK